MLRYELLHHYKITFSCKVKNHKIMIKCQICIPHQEKTAGKYLKYYFELLHYYKI